MKCGGRGPLPPFAVPLGTSLRQRPSTKSAAAAWIRQELTKCPEGVYNKSVKQPPPQMTDAPAAAYIHSPHN